MKRSTMAFVTAATILAAVACAKKEHKNPAAKPDAKVDNPADVADAKSLEAARLAAQRAQKNQPNNPPFNPDPEIKHHLNQAYIGPLLQLKYVDSDPEPALIKLRDEDAKNLYQALRLEEESVAENDNYLPSKVKNGESIRCAVAAQKNSPDLPEYSCSIEFDYSSGAARILTQGLKLDSKVSVLQKLYKGISILLDPGHVAPADPTDLSVNLGEPKTEGSQKAFVMEKQKPFAKVETTASRTAGPLTPQPVGKLRITGTDARILYSLLRVSEVNNGQTLLVAQKTGENIACQKITAEKDKTPAQYVCRVTFDYMTGVVTRLAPAQLPAAE